MGIIIPLIPGVVWWVIKRYTEILSRGWGVTQWQRLLSMDKVLGSVPSTKTKQSKQTKNPTQHTTYPTRNAQQLLANHYSYYCYL
jgi:hypothetical protein